MPLSDEVIPLLDAVNSLGVDLPDMDVGSARTSYAATFGGPGPDVVTVDRSVPGPAGEVGVRVYTPAGVGPFPLVVYLHGGGGCIGDLDSHDADARRLCAGATCVVVSVDYRLAPEHPFPAAIDDVSAVLRWASVHAGAVGGDPDRLAVVGESYGATLAAVGARRARDEGIALALQVLLYPVTDWRLGHDSVERNGERLLMTRAGLEWFRSHLFGNEAQWTHPDASPLLAEDVSGVAPALVVVAEHDPLHDEGVALAERLEEAGVPVTLSDYDGMIHGFVTLAHLLPTGEVAHREIATALRGALS